MRIPEYPPILTGDPKQDSINLREYIIRNIEYMQQQLLQAGGSIYVENGEVYVSINGDTMTLQEFIENNVNVDGDTINITVNATIETHADLQEKTVNVTENGDFSVMPDAGKDGLSKVNLHVTVPIDGPSGTLEITANGTYNVTDYASADVDVEPDLQSKSVTITTNGSRTITPDTGKDGLSSVAITVNVPGSTPSLDTLTIAPAAADRTFTPGSGYVGYSQVVAQGAPLEQKNVTPGASSKNVTPSSGFYGLSKVVVAGDADLIASNIKKNVNIFGVTGTYEPTNVPINGSLIEITCSSNIDQVTATVNGHTYTAYLDTTTHKAYVTIPYTDTAAARTCVLKGYVESLQATSANLSMAAGVGYYTATLTTYEWLFKNGTWYGLDTHEWIRLAPSSYAGRINVTEGNVLTFALAAQTGGSTRYAWEYLSPKLSRRGFSQLEIVVDSKATNDTVTVYCGSSVSSADSPGRALSVGTNLIPLAADDFYLEFYMNDWNTRTPNTVVISTIRFV